MIEIDYTDFSYKVISDISHKEITDVYEYDDDLYCGFDELPFITKIGDDLYYNSDMDDEMNKAEIDKIYKLSKKEVEWLYENSFNNRG